MTCDREISVLVLGASYGLLPAVRIAMAGHPVTVMCRGDEAQAIATSGAMLRLPERGGGPVFDLKMPAHLGAGHAGSIGLVTPGEENLKDIDFVILAVQEPQLTSPDLHSVMQDIATANIPVLSLQNMPPPPFLTRVGIDTAITEGAYTDLSVWRNFDPDLFSLASPDAQAVRKNADTPGVLTVTLPTNFKAAPFADEGAQDILLILSRAVDRARAGGRRPSVRLVASDDVHTPLAKWPMLICGNCRCLRAGEPPVSIAEAVATDIEGSREIYSWVSSIVRAVGAPEGVLVPFDRYTEAARGLTLPSSLARGLANGAKAVERIDLLVGAIAQDQGIDTAPLEPITRLIDQKLDHSKGINAVA